MSIFADFVKTGDFKGEKHVPVISAPESINKDEKVEVKVTVGEAIAHPNTLEHHIAWIKLFFVEDDGKFLVELGDAQFTAHNGSFTEPTALFKVQLPATGKLVALSYCNIHGLWSSEKAVQVK